MQMIHGANFFFSDRRVIKFILLQQKRSRYGVDFQLTAFRLSFPAREIIARVAILKERFYAYFNCSAIKCNVRFEIVDDCVHEAMSRGKGRKKKRCLCLRVFWWFLIFGPDRRTDGPTEK